MRLYQHEQGREESCIDKEQQKNAGTRLVLIRYLKIMNMADHL